DAMEVLEWMDERGVKPNAQLYVCLLKPCKNITIGKRVHLHIIKTRTKWDQILTNSLLNMYAKCGSMDDALSVFNSMQSRDVVSWTAMIAGYAQSEKKKEALGLFGQMQQVGIQPNQFTYIVVLSAC